MSAAAAVREWKVGILDDRIRIETVEPGKGYFWLCSMEPAAAEALAKELLRAVEMLRLVPAVEAKALVRG